MPINGEVVVSPELYRSMIKNIARKALRTQRIAGAVVSVVGVLLYLTGEKDIRGVALGLAIAGVFVAILLPLRVLSVSVKRAAPSLSGPWRYEITPESIRQTTSLATSEWTWQSLVGFEDHPEFWLLRTQIKLQAVAIVKAAFSPADQAAIAAIGAARFSGTGTVAR